MTRTRVLVVAVAIVVLLVAVGAISALTRDPKRTYVLPKCARPAHPVKPPRPFPRAFPLPKGTTFSTLARYPTQIILGGRAPLEFAATINFLIRELPGSGFRLGRGESEPGFEAESDFAGHGVVGRFKVRILPRCRGAVLFIVSVAREGTLTPTPIRSVRACAGRGGKKSHGLPPTFPLPAKTIVRSTVERTVGGRAVRYVTAVAPGTIDGAAKFILTKFPSAGYRLLSADREATEADGTFAGHGVGGRIRFHTMLACAGVLTIDIATTTSR